MTHTNPHTPHHIHSYSPTQTHTCSYKSTPTHSLITHTHTHTHTHSPSHTHTQKKHVEVDERQKPVEEVHPLAGAGGELAAALKLRQKQIKNRERK